MRTDQGPSTHRPAAGRTITAAFEFGCVRDRKCGPNPGDRDNGKNGGGSGDAAGSGRS